MACVRWYGHDDYPVTVRDLYALQGDLVLMIVDEQQYGAPGDVFQNPKVVSLIHPPGREAS